MNLYSWGIKHGIPQAAIDDLRIQMRLSCATESDHVGGFRQLEAGAQQRVRMDAAARGGLLWRNNVGACEDNRGNHIRYGLANESKAMNSNIKSSDLIGISPVVVSAEMVGYKIGVFTAREVKKPGWVYSGNPREEAQRKFGELVLAHGGDFQFIT